MQYGYGYFFRVKVCVDLEGLQRAVGVRGGKSEGVSHLGTQCRVLWALCPNANDLKVTS